MTPPRSMSSGAIVAYSMGSLGSSIVTNLASAAFPLMLTTYNLATWQVLLLAQERSLVGGVVQPLIGIASDRFPPNRLGRRRPFMLVGAPATALSLLVLSTHPSRLLAVATITLMALFLALASDPYYAMLTDLAPSGQRSRVGGVMAIFQMIGQAFAVVVSALWWETNEQLVFVVDAAVLVASFLLTSLLVQEPAHVPRPTGPGPRTSTTAYVRDLVGRPELMKYLAATSLYWFGLGGVLPAVTLFGVRVLHTTESQAFELFLPALVGVALTAYPAGLLAERHGKKPVLFVGTALFSAATLIGSQIASTFAEGLVVMFVIGVANGVGAALAFPLLTDLIPPERAGEFTGIGSTAWSLSQPLGVVVLGLLADAGGGIRMAFLGAGVCFVLSCFALLTVHPDRALVASTHEPTAPLVPEPG